MWRRVGCLLAGLLLLVSTSRGQQDESVLGKNAAEWLKVLRDGKEAKLRRAAVIALEVFGAKKAGVTAGLIDALAKEPEAEIRREIVQTLGRMGMEAKGAVEALGEALKKDKADIVREAAARALGGRLASQAHTQVMVLAGALKDSHSGTRAAAAEALRELGEKAKPALAEVIYALKDKKADRFTRIYSAQILGRLKTEAEASVPLLVAVLNEKEAAAGVREAATESLGRLGPDAASAIPDLAKALGEKQPALRRAVVVALAQMGEKVREAWPAIRIALKDTDSGVRYQAISLAGRVAKDEKQAVLALAETGLKDDSTEVRLAAIRELATMGSAANAAAPTLTKIAANDSRVSVREAASAALKKIKEAP
jgi:HEAT repeat protein